MPSWKFKKLEKTDLKHLNKEFEESDHVTKDKLARKDEPKRDDPPEQNETLDGGLPEIKSVEIKTRKGFSVHRVQEYKGIVLENHAHTMYVVLSLVKGVVNIIDIFMTNSKN